MAALALAALAVAGTGCGDSVNLPGDRVWTSEHFRYGTRADDATVCEGIVDTLEAHFAAIHAYLGITWPGAIIDYYKFRDTADFHGNGDCPAAADACANGSLVESPLVLHGHELVHVYSRHLGRPPWMFEEGLAEALSPQGRIFLARPQTWREVLATPLLAGGVPQPLVYYAGAWFVTYLLRHHGAQPFVAFYSTVRADADEAEVASAFEQAYGVPLDDEWQRALDEAPDEKGVPVWECTAPPLALGGDTVDLSERCDGRGAFATFSLSEETPLVWHDAASLSFGFNLASCAPDAELHATEIGGTGALESGALSLPAGPYYVTPVYGGGTLGLAIAANAIATSCADAQPLLLTAAAVNLTLVIGDTSAPRFVKLHHADEPTFALTRKPDDWYVPDVFSASVEICPDCSGSCSPLDNAVETPIADGQILRLTALDAPRGATVVRFGYR